MLNRPEDRGTCQVTEDLKRLFKKLQTANIQLDRLEKVPDRRRTDDTEQATAEAAVKVRTVFEQIAELANEGIAIVDEAQGENFEDVEPVEENAAVEPEDTSSVPAESNTGIVPPAEPEDEPNEDEESENPDEGKPGD